MPDTQLAKASLKAATNSTPGPDPTPPESNRLNTRTDLVVLIALAIGGPDGIKNLYSPFSVDFSMAAALHPETD